MKSENNKTKVSLARALSKLGFCSRTEAETLIRKKGITVNNKTVINPSFRVDLNKDIIKSGNEIIKRKYKIYIMLNKPPGYVTTRADEKDRKTVYDLIDEKKLTYLFPVGRLDMASEGLLLMTNDTKWANKITSPEHNISKVYQVQINKLADMDMLMKMKHGVISDGEMLRVRKAKLLRKGDKNSWIEVTLDEGKNRHIRRIIGELDAEVMRLIRVSIGGLKLGSLPKGKYRRLKSEEVELF